MARTPTDPTKAQVWVTKGMDDLDFEFYFPQGPKGDPGGISLGTPLDTTTDSGTGKFNLNDVKVSGVYRMMATVSSGLAVRNYPRDSDTGILVVYERVTGQTLIQEWRSISQQGRGVYVRNMTTTDTWTPWRFMPTSRVDQTAGRAIYQWDDLNNREQLVYGDTGWRNIIMQSVSQVGNMHIRRNGHLVTLNVVGYSMSAASVNGNYGIFFAGGQLAGFTPGVTGRCVATTSAGVVRIIDIVPTNAEMRIFDGTLAAYSWSMTWPTNDAWPTSLPGTAVNNIPNL